jgi:hypothetical protein
MRHHIVSCATAVSLALLVAPRFAEAHDNPVHADMTDLSWQVMRLVATQRAGLDPCGLGPQIQGVAQPPAGVSANDWNAFLADVAAAVPALDTLPAGLPGAPLCDSFGQKVSGVAPWPSVGAVSKALDSYYYDAHAEGTCGFRKGNTGWRPGGIFNKLPVGNATSATGSRFAGTVLGVHAAHPDELTDDLAYGINPLTAAGIGAAIAKLDKEGKIGAEILLIGFVCAYDFLSGNGSNCVDDTKNIVNKYDPAQLAGLLNVGTFHNDELAAVFHFVTVGTGLHSEQFDTPQGLLYDEAGIDNVPDVIDLGLMTLFDLIGASVAYDASDGPKNYEVTSADDGVRNTSHRDKLKWQSQPLGHTAFEPLDNLAYYGWARFRGDPTHSADSLAWPLHAMGDAVAPHHLIGSTGYGHRPFEDAVRDQWGQIRFQAGNGEAIQYDAPSTTDLPGVDGEVAQLALATDILKHAYAYRQFITSWRGSNGGGTDIPIRQLVVKLANDTWNDLSVQPTTPYGAGSFAYWTGGDDKATSIAKYESSNDRTTMRALIVRGAGATIAFLTSAAESVPKANIPAPAPDTGCLVNKNLCSTCLDCGGGLGCVPDAVTGNHVCDVCTQDADCCDGTCVNGACVPKAPPTCVNFYVCQGAACATSCDPTHPTCCGGAECLGNACVDPKALTACNGNNYKCDSAGHCFTQCSTSDECCNVTACKVSNGVGECLPIVIPLA